MTYTLRFLSEVEKKQKAPNNSLQWTQVSPRRMTEIYECPI